MLIRNSGANIYYNDTTYYTYYDIEDLYMVNTIDPYIFNVIPTFLGKQSKHLIKSIIYNRKKDTDNYVYEFNAQNQPISKEIVKKYPRNYIKFTFKSCSK